MLLHHICAVAFFCQKCGKIHIQDIPYFSGRREFVLRCSNCSHEQAVIRLHPRQGLIIETSCSACGEKNRLNYPLSVLRQLDFEKIYCQKDHFELGYIGSWQSIAEFLDFNEAEYDALHPTDAADYMEHQQILLEALNRVHDLAAKQKIFCSCGSHDFVADVMEHTIRLECMRCGGSVLIPANSSEDLNRIVPGIGILSEHAARS